MAYRDLVNVARRFDKFWRQSCPLFIMLSFGSPNRICGIPHSRICRRFCIWHQRTGGIMWRFRCLKCCEYSDKRANTTSCIEVALLEAICPPKHSLPTRSRNVAWEGRAALPSNIERIRESILPNSTRCIVSLRKLL